MALITKSFNGAQVFYVDPSVVDGARTCDISAIDLYFKFKPDVTLNMTGTLPGVSLFIADTMYGIPRITRESGVFTGQEASVTLDDVLTSSDATVPTTFRFARPVTIETDKEYSFVFEFDLLSQFELWTSVQGEILTGSTNVSPGPSDKFIGRFFDFNNIFAADDNTNLDEYLKNWRPRQDTSLKFSVKIARYAHVGVPVGANGSIDSDDIIRTRPAANIVASSSGTNFNINFGSYEYISFNENRSTKSAYVGGMMAYQNTVFHPGGYQNGGTYLALTTESGNNIVTANSQLPSGDTFQWSSIFTATNPFNRLVITDGTTTNIRTVTAIQSNTVIELDEPVSFSNTDAKFMITPTGRVSSFDRSSPFGVDSAFVMIGNSAANSTVRFTNNQITSVAITGGGSGYSNSDVLHIKGFENVADKVTGGYVATANIVTDGTGAITAVYFSNTGCGFVNTNAIEAVVANSTQTTNTTSNTSAGSSATFSYFTGAVIKTEYGNSSFVDCEVRNLDLGEFIPYHNIDVPPGVGYALKLETNYIKKDDATTLSGEAFFVNDGVSNNQLDIVMYDLNVAEFLEETPAVMSKSNEFVTVFEDGSPNDKIGNVATSSTESIKLITDVTADSDFATVRQGRPSVQFGKYIINNDATGEHSDFGNAFAKGLTKTVDFKRTAEDIRVFLTAYKPANTDLKVYARIFKNEDPEAFDDKNWTELELKDGNGLVSSSANPLDYVQLEYGFFQVPQDRTVLDGTVTLTSGSTTVDGVGTDFVTDLASGDLVYLYQPLFPENHMVVSVSSVTDANTIEIDTSTTNTSILAEGMSIEKITYPMQAFNNKQNDNVVRYYNSNQGKFDGYESMAIKIVFLSDSPHRIPRVDDLSGTGVSA